MRLTDQNNQNRGAGNNGAFLIQLTIKIQKKKYANASLRANYVKQNENALLIVSKIPLNRAPEEGLTEEKRPKEKSE